MRRREKHAYQAFASSISDFLQKVDFFELWDPNSGGVFVNGTNIKDLTVILFDLNSQVSFSKLQDLRSQIALVSQDVYLFHGNVRENIAYGKPDATEEEIRRAAELAHFSEEILQLPKG